MTRSHLALTAGPLILAAMLSACGGVRQTADKKFKEEAAYNEAAELYKQALASGKGSPEYLNGQIAESYRLSNRPALAVPYYQAAMQAGSKADSLKYYYAQALKSAGMSQEAKAAFATYGNEGKKSKWIERAKLEETNIDKIPALQGKGSEYEVTNVEALNTAGSEYSPMIVSAGDELAFTATRGGRIFSQNGLPFSDIYHVKVGEMAAGVMPAAYDKFNTGDRHEASITIAKDGKMAIFARSNDGSRKGATDVDLFMSRMDKDGAWSDPEMLSISSATAWDASPALSADGKTLYFASNREGGKGGIDLYRSALDQNGRWGKVTNLGADINTAGDEMFPAVSDDGKLFFASDGQAGFGNLDLFVATRTKDEGTKVENLGQPMNSKSDDFAITFKNGYEGYFSSNRDGGKGDDDIYYFLNALAEPHNVRYVLNGAVGNRVGGQQTGGLPGASVKIQQDGKTVATAQTDGEGKFSAPLEENKPYTLLVEKDGYFTKRDAVTTVDKRPTNAEMRGKKDVEVSIPFANALDKIKLEERIVVENIYYGYDSSDIRPAAALELDKIVTMLNDNPAITIELSSHTDARGDDKYNQKLSAARASSAEKYIESKGVALNRISSKGYGEARPIVKDAKTEEEFQKNRRTEFKVTKIAK